MVERSAGSWTMCSVRVAGAKFVNRQGGEMGGRQAMDLQIAGGAGACDLAVGAVLVIGCCRG